MIELTEEQQRALYEEDPPRVLDPVTREMYFLVRSDLYERLRLVFDDLPDASVLVNELMAEDDAVLANTILAMITGTRAPPAGRRTFW